MKTKPIPSEFKKNLQETLNLNKLETAYFIERPNRFIVHCEDDSGKFIRAHLPNPGRLHELFFPRVKLYLLKASDEVKVSKVPRRTSYTVIAVERDSRPIFLHTHHSNTLVELLLNHSLISSLKDYSIVKREAKHGHSRFDFLLQKTSHMCELREGNSWDAHKATIENKTYSGKGLLWLEVKSCTLFGNRVAMFPDAITERGRRHLEELAKLSDEGVDCAVLFAIHSPHIEYFMPDFHTDLQFSNTLIRLRDKLRIIPLSIPWTKKMTIETQPTEVTVPWNYLKTEVCDEGSYMLLSYFKENKTCAGSYEDLEIKKGWHIYTGYSDKELSKKIRGYKNRQKKTLISKADVLAKYGDTLILLPVRAPRDNNCQINMDVQKLAKDNRQDRQGEGAFRENEFIKTSSRTNQGQLALTENSCSCPDHYAFFKEDPLDLKEFHTIIERYRMKHPH